VVSAAIDSTTLFIGDQTDLHLRATCETSEQLLMPILEEQLVPGIEIVDRTIVDTTILNDGRVQYNQYLTLTSFKDSLFYISPLPFVSGGDTMWSESLMLNVVQPFEMDSADIAITDIKGIYKAPIWWWGVLRWILLALATVVVIAGVCLLVFVGTLGDYLESDILPNSEVTLEGFDLSQNSVTYYLDANGELQVHLIDWEYAGMQDPHVDLAMFCIYALYDRTQVDRLIDLYFPEGCSTVTRIKIYCYIAACGLLWSNWCEYKRGHGVEFGAYSIAQYRYAKEYFRIAQNEIQKIQSN
jgi:hypothetical protein